MTTPVRLVGAGLGRTGTRSLKLAIERLLGTPAYHMVEIFSRPDDVAVWRRAADGDLPRWSELFDGFGAVLDWPAAAFYAEIADAFPEAPVLLSTRSDPQTWWRSADGTVIEVLRQPPSPGLEAWHDMWAAIVRSRFSEDPNRPDAAMAAYERHNAEVRANISPDRLVEWQPGDGWEPLCTALGVPVPDEPFPHTNSIQEFRDRQRWDGDPAT